MMKSYIVGSGKEAMTFQAPVVSTIELQEHAPDPALVAWLSSQDKSGERGIVLKRIGGIALIVVGLIIALFSLIFFPGLLFWFLGAAGLGLAGLGVMLMFSKRTKDPQAAFKAIYKEGFLSGGEGTSTVHTSTLFNKTASAKKRVEGLCPIAGLELNEQAIEHFNNSLGGLINVMFVQHGTLQLHPSEQCTFAVFCDPEITSTQIGENTHLVQGVVNVVRRNPQGASEIAELRIKQVLICLHGYYMPVNLIPNLPINSYNQQQLPFANNRGQQFAVAS